MSNENILISTVFKGEIADNAEIKSRDIIKAIEGFEESIAMISKKIYGKKCITSCTLKAPKEGSFELNYLFQFIGVTSILFDSISIEDLPNVISIIYDLYIKTEGKKVKSVEQNNENGINVTIEDNSTTIINYNNCSPDIDPSIVRDTLNDDKIREAITKSHAPITNSSANKVIYKDANNKELSIVTKENYKSFNPLSERIIEDEKEMQLWVKGLSFDQKKWDFQDKLSEENFSAQITDINFQKIILEGESFKNGDSIIADVFIKYSDKKNKKNQYTVVKVIKHIAAPTQLKIE